MKTKLLQVLRPATIGALWRYYLDPSERLASKVVLPLAALYVVSPIDVIPELATMTAGTALAGPIGALLGLAAGYADDAAVAVWLLGRVEEITRTHAKSVRDR